ncbi:MAG: hypothetical protein H6R15_1843 [Proteobacteria bacterium]|nr:hypothetical protein [Pseudomonadota bacterium]
MLSAEIIVIALGTVAGQPFATQVTVLVGIALIMTVGVYGFVAGIVKMDDLGLYLLKKGHGAAKTIGKGLLLTAPKLVKVLTVIGTIAMFLVGGVVAALLNALVGIVGGGLALLAVTLFGKLAGVYKGSRP